MFPCLNSAAARQWDLRSDFYPLTSTPVSAFGFDLCLSSWLWHMVSVSAPGFYLGFLWTSGDLLLPGSEGTEPESHAGAAWTHDEEPDNGRVKGQVSTICSSTLLLIAPPPLPPPHSCPPTSTLLLLPAPAAPRRGCAAGREDERHPLLLGALYLLGADCVLLPGASERRRWADCWAGMWAELLYGLLTVLQLIFSACSIKIGFFAFDTNKW